MENVEALNESISKEQYKLKKATRLHSVHWLIFTLSLLLTFIAWYFAEIQVHEKNQVKFNRQANQVVALVKERMKIYENALWGAVAFYDANNGEVTLTQWNKYANSLDLDKNYPGVNGIGVIYNIALAQKSNFITLQQKDQAQYTIHPFHQRKDLWPITYITPLERNRSALGLDIAFEDNRYQGVIRSRNSGKASITAPIQLVQDARKTPGFLFYAPIYQGGNVPTNEANRISQIIGVTYAPFIMDQLMNGTLERHLRYVNVTIHDDGEILYSDYDAVQPSVDPSPLFTKQIAINIYQREWLFNIASDLNFREKVADSQSLFILAGGLIIDLMLLMLFLFFTKANREALKHVNKMTRDMLQKTRLLERSNQDLEQFSYVASHDLKSPIHGIIQVSQWIEEDCAELIPEESQKHLRLLQNRGQRMLSLLNDLLDYGRISKIDKGIEKINLAALCQKEFDLLNANNHFSLNVNNITLILPRIPLALVIRNLLSNAIKHHDKKQGAIHIKAQQFEHYYEIEVCDDGPGIPVDMRDKAVEMFQTLQPRDKVEGSGMGLAIVKRVLAHIGGDLIIETNQPRGARFVTKWPIVNLSRGKDDE